MPTLNSDEVQEGLRLASREIVALTIPAERRMRSLVYASIDAVNDGVNGILARTQHLWLTDPQPDRWAEPYRSGFLP